MTPDDFIRKWRGVTQTERASSQSHFIDLCRLVGQPEPIAADPQGKWFCFEKGASKAGEGDGWADVWRRGYFGWEYKRPGGSLEKAFKQLQLYTPGLEYPPLLIVSDVQVIRIHTAFTGMVPTTYLINLEDLRDPAKLNLLKWAFTDPEQLKPTQTRAHLTEQAAVKLGALAQTWRGRGHDPLRVAHFTQQVLFCLFAEDIDLLPNQMFTRMLKAAQAQPDKAQGRCEALFGAMATGGDIGFETIDWFNGGLFTEAQALPLELADLKQLQALAALDWSAIDPTIAGTLFVRSLDPALRAQLGAEYTDPPTIMRLVDPVLLDPLRAEWATVKAEIQRHLDKAHAARSPGARTKATQAAMELYQGFLHRLQRFRVLDPACGSGNFLLLSLLGLKDLEHQVITEAEALGLPRQFPAVGPENVIGIEINPFAAELARVSIWIGEIQWMLNHGFALAKNPILRNLDNIHLRDAILNPDGSEPEWPEADVIVGNPPFLGGARKRAVLGDAYFDKLDWLYRGRIPAGVDLVGYWFLKSLDLVREGKIQRAGLVATNSIRQPGNRKVLEKITQESRIFNAWSDEPWINEGASVRVSLVCFANQADGLEACLDGQVVPCIYPDLRSGINLTMAKPLSENQGMTYFGLALAGPFSVDEQLARKWLTQPNPNGKPNSDVLRPLWNGRDLTARWEGRWTIDFGPMMDESEAMYYELPFEYVVMNVKPLRLANRRKSRAEKWWRHGEARPAMRKALTGHARFFVTSEKSKHRFFAWLESRVAPDNRLIVFTRSDDMNFGVLSSRIHVCWALAVGSTLEDRPAYATTTCFDPFPFPEGLTPADTAGPVETLEDGVVLPPVAPERRPLALAIAQAAHRLNANRENWLNPHDWVERVPEVVPGYPDRIIPKPGKEKDLKARTLTNLYNQRPHWLVMAHQALDAAVAAAYGWDDYTSEMADKEILGRLLALNLERSSQSGA